MSTHKHYFLAISIPEEIKEGLTIWQQELHTLPFDYKEWVHPKDFHLTMKFLGGVADKKLEELCKDLNQETHAFSPFPMKGSGYGTFGKSKSPRVLWAGVETPPDLFEQQKKIDEICFQNGFSKENRSFNPHITVAKKWREGQFQPSLMPELPLAFKREWTVEDLVLYQIHPSKNPKYEKIESFHFK